MCIFKESGGLAMRKKVTILWTIMLVVGTLSVLPMTGSAATPHEFEAWDMGAPQIINATDMMDPNEGIARMWAEPRPYEVATTWPDPTYTGTSDLVGENGDSLNNNSFQVDTTSFTSWADGENFIFAVEKDPNSTLTPKVYDNIGVPNGYVASPAPVAIDELLPKQPTGMMTLEKIPAPYFSTTDGVNYTINWTVMVTPNIMYYRIYESTTMTGPWTLFEEVAMPPSTLYAQSGRYYSLGINWTGTGGGVISLVQGAPEQFNTAPTLTWTGETGFTADGVSPDSGPANCRDFEFRVDYSDPNDDAPLSGEVWVHIMDNSVPIVGSPFLMLQDDPSDTTFTDGKIYYYMTQLPVGANLYQYYFEANDSWNTPAGGLGTVVTNGPDVGANAAPTILVTVPDTTAHWTGGTPHDILMTVDDDYDVIAPEFNMWLNLSYSYGVVGPVSIIDINDIPTNLSSYTWNTPNTVTATDVIVTAQLTDSCGAFVSGNSLQFEIDSEPPTVLFSPADGTTGVSVATDPILTFSEDMNQASVLAAITFVETVSGTPISYTPIWTGNDVLTLAANDLSQYTDYTVSVDMTALDDSDPGNNLTANTATFTTEDTENPVITIVTAPDATGVCTDETITIVASVTDNVGVDNVNISWGLLGSLKTVATMTLSSGTNYTYTIPAQTTTGLMEFVVGATDMSGNTASSSPRTFPVDDCGVQPGQVMVTIGVLDPDNMPIDGATVTVKYSGNGTVVETGTTILGVYIVTVGAGDYSITASASGYQSKTASLSLDGTEIIESLTIKLEKEGDIMLWLIIIIIIIIIVVLILVLLMLKRRKKPEEEGAVAEEEEYEEEAADEEMVEEEAEEELGEEEEVEEELEEEERE